VGDAVHARIPELSVLTKLSSSARVFSLKRERSFFQKTNRPAAGFAKAKPRREQQQPGGHEHQDSHEEGQNAIQG
jgi:hypothetical protein